MHRVGVVIAAGGAGKRFGGSVPKQFLKVQGVPILERTISLFASLRVVDEIVVVSSLDHVGRVEKLVRRMGCGKIVSIVPGGRERQDSVWNGLHAFIAKPDIILVHDAARPLVSRKVVEAVVAGAISNGAAVVGVRICDTIKMEGKKGFYERTLDRKRLWAVQTPQGFRFDLLLKAHKAARRGRYMGTDESSLVERLAIPVRIVEGNQSNIKITTRQDLRLAEMWLTRG
jgi:2-C-methyl-D-erythritol 4-phosphate cytidylyltransferase